MKILSKVLCITAFFAISSASARVGKSVGKPSTTAPGRPGGHPTTDPLFVMQGKTFKQLRDMVLTMKQSDVIDSKTGLLSDSFIKKMADEISVSTLAITPLEEFEFETLLNIARDKFAQFSGANEKDRTLLAKFKAQIAEEVDRFK